MKRRKEMQKVKDIIIPSIFYNKEEIEKDNRAKYALSIYLHMQLNMNGQNHFKFETKTELAKELNINYRTLVDMLDFLMINDLIQPTKKARELKINTYKKGQKYINLDPDKAELIANLSLKNKKSMQIANIYALLLNIQKQRKIENNKSFSFFTKSIQSILNIKNKKTMKELLQVLVDNKLIYYRTQPIIKEDKPTNKYQSFFAIVDSWKSTDDKEIKSEPIRTQNNNNEGGFGMNIDIDMQPEKREPIVLKYNAKSREEREQDKRKREYEELKRKKEKLLADFENNDELKEKYKILHDYKLKKAEELNDIFEIEYAKNYGPKEFIKEWVNNQLSLEMKIERIKKEKKMGLI